MENKLAELIDLAKHIPEDFLGSAIDALKRVKSQADDNKPDPTCPHCGSDQISKNGNKDGKQRFLCRACSRTFGAVTDTVMHYSHSPEAVWKQVVRDTIEGVSIDKTAESLSLSHNNVFTMRHKILLALEQERILDPTTISGVCEADETYVLESYKGTKLEPDFWREPRKHGAVAQTPGISSEYVCICTVTSREGGAVARTVNRATPSREDISEALDSRMAADALILCDGARSYDVLVSDGVCNVTHIKADETDDFYNINTTNGFHSFIKERYRSARGVATKYLNRYNALFEKTYRGSKYLADEIFNIMFDGNHRFNTISATKENLLLEF
jgi:transposase-like protein